MKTKELVKSWFDTWERGDFHNLPVSEDFVHISPYGTIEGKSNYLELVEANEKQFLGHRFKILDGLYENNRACVRYLAIKQDFEMEVSEWYYLGEKSINKIVAYYNIEGEINEDRKLPNPEAYN